MQKSSSDNPEPLQNAYAILSGDDATERACRAIPDAQCTAVPKNFVLNVFNGACTKLAEQLVSPTLVLPWLVAALGAPVAAAGWFVPIKQAGSLIPQMLVAARIRGLAQRKWAWAGAGAIQSACLVLMAVAILVLPASAAAWCLLALFTVFSIASGIGSVAFQDVTGKTVPKGVRGRMLANRASIGGALTLLGAAGLKFGLDGGDDIAIYAALIGVAALLWFVAAGAFAVIEEVPGASDGGRGMAAELKASLRLFKDDPSFKRYLTMRILLVIGVELAPPYFALLAQQSQGAGLSELGILIFAVGGANIVASWLWGGLADNSARRVCAYAAGVGAISAVAALISAYMVADAFAIWAFAGVFVLAGIAESGVRLGRKTYLVDAAPSDERPLYTALSNTLAGVSALLAGSLGFVAMALGAAWVVAFLATVSAFGMLAAWLMPEADA